MSVPRVLSAAIIVAAITLSSAAASTVAQVSAHAAKPALPGLPENEHVAFIESVHEELNQQHFAALDQMAGELLRIKARFPGGYWKLFHFYDALSRPGSKDQTYSDQAWEKHIATLRLWQLQHKTSASAAIALGESWTKYAWNARGTGYSDKVTDDMERAFQQRLTVAEKTLKAAAELAKTNPHWYRALIVLARGQGWDRSDADALFDDAIKVEPQYPHLYSAFAIYLMPRWHGEEGDWERFADIATRRVGGREGAAIYSHIVLNISVMYSGEDFFTENKMSWPRIRQALVDREALYGTNRHTLNMSCWLAGAAVDKPTTRVLLARIGQAWDPEVWKARKWFDEYRTWVEEK